MASLATAIVGCAVSTHSNALPINDKVHTSSGLVVGNPADASGIINFKGIPYAQPPVGELRWKPPRPFLSPGAHINATQFGSQCWAASGVPGVPVNPTNKSEDCLTLNVWTPATSAHIFGQLPVMVWVHGGGFQFGTSADPAYDGTALAKKVCRLVP